MGRPDNFPPEWREALRVAGGVVALARELQFGDDAGLRKLVHRKSRCSRLRLAIIRRWCADHGIESPI